MVTSARLPSGLITSSNTTLPFSKGLARKARLYSVYKLLLFASSTRRIAASERPCPALLLLGEPGAGMSLPAGDQVRDFFNRMHNHIPELDALAERLFAEWGLTVGHMAPRLRQLLADHIPAAARWLGGAEASAPASAGPAQSGAGNGGV